ncbi:nucleoporin Nup35 [Bombus affinis]|uniref:nucleoporin Nup35 n=1 Tax=Bombus affinis TaxID=309941 RepID=UPI0021B82C13|nr:nucleoporin Nup35 [Bombus affinis]XP_050597716.1 nucleoporin Nup35 [Bombus affinis]
MEPMALGSPVGSPVQSPGSPGTSAYLPNFLLGDSTTPAKISLMGPQDILKQSHIGHSALTSPPSHYGTPDYRSNRQKAVFGSANTPNTSQIVTESHTGGPPTRGLFDTLETSQTVSPYLSATNQSIPCHQPRLLVNSMNTSIFNDGAMSPNANESQGLLQWVTVFGFSPSDMNTVLAHISSRVRVVDKHPPPHSQSNWIHLKCASELEAQRALACNGNIVSGSIMIGLIPCTDEGVILGSDKESRSRMNGSIKCFSSLGRVTQSPEYNTPRTPIRIQNARPLAAGYNQNLSSQSVSSPENVPQKSTGLVSKAMEYMFGW